MVVFWFVAITLGLGMLMGRFAESKGYGFWHWFFASSLLGIIWLVSVPNLKSTTKFTEEEAVKKANGTNIAGIIISVFGQLLAISQVASVNLG